MTINMRVLQLVYVERDFRPPIFGVLPKVWSLSHWFPSSPFSFLSLLLLSSKSWRTSKTCFHQFLHVAKPAQNRRPATLHPSISISRVLCPDVSIVQAHVNLEVLDIFNIQAHLLAVGCITIRCRLVRQKRFGELLITSQVTVGIEVPLGDQR